MRAGQEPFVSLTARTLPPFTSLVPVDEEEHSDEARQTDKASPGGRAHTHRFSLPSGPAFGDFLCFHL